jgi:hypothetical protein
MASLRQRFSSFRSRTRDGEGSPVNKAAPQVNEVEIADVNLQFVVEKAENESPASYQDASGAPVEVHSPLGYAVGPFTIVFLNISRMIGTGVYSTRMLFRTSRRTIFNRM